MAKYKINFELTRDDDLRDDDESWFDKEHISNEIKSWLEDLDYRVNNITIDEVKDYHEKKSDILWEYISDKDIPEIQKRLEELEK